MSSSALDTPVYPGSIVPKSALSDSAQEEQQQQQAATQSKRPDILIEAETARIAQIADRSQEAPSPKNEKYGMDTTV
ncbi:hypothetical protein DHEL01_v212557 [Diaporthe helianthi]|uniref:Uncharacterized protein n=1 Tax=Diaporthe helianthi TaxID=158607 RepID=A0A2P5HFP2_DIAHE|nr:hypothetical protein DHEL01_v212557 [Diaporthe helianthi]